MIRRCKEVRNRLLPALMVGPQILPAVVVVLALFLGKSIDATRMVLLLR
jgi:hypothetical protein